MLKNIIEKYKYNIQSIIKKITGKPNEDIEQEVYLKTWKNLDKYQENGKFRQWLNTITANLCRDYLKSAYNRRENTFLTEEESTNLVSQKSNVEDIFESKLRRKKVAQAIHSLPSKLRETIVLYELEGCDYQEIASRLNCPLGTVKSRIYKARQELYTQLQEFI